MVKFLLFQLLLESSGEPLSNDQQSLLRLAKQNLVVVNLLASGRLPNARISFERGHHLYFPLLRLDQSGDMTNKRNSSIAITTDDHSSASASATTVHA